MVVTNREGETVAAYDLLTMNAVLSGEVTARSAVKNSGPYRAPVARDVDAGEVGHVDAELFAQTRDLRRLKRQRREHSLLRANQVHRDRVDAGGSEGGAVFFICARMASSSAIHCCFSAGSLSTTRTHEAP